MDFKSIKILPSQYKNISLPPELNMVSTTFKKKKIFKDILKDEIAELKNYISHEKKMITQYEIESEINETRREKDYRQLNKLIFSFFGKIDENLINDSIISYCNIELKTLIPPDFQEKTKKTKKRRKKVKENIIINEKKPESQDKSNEVTPEIIISNEKSKESKEKFEENEENEKNLRSERKLKEKRISKKNSKYIDSAILTSKKKTRKKKEYKLKFCECCHINFLRHICKHTYCENNCEKKRKEENIGKNKIKLTNFFEKKNE